MADLDLLSFFSEHPIDKIVQVGQFIVDHPGAIARTVPGQEVNAPYERVVEVSEPNEYGRAGFIRAVWSIDNGNTWQSMETSQQDTASYTLTINGSSPVSQDYQYGVMQVVVGSTDTLVKAKVYRGAMTSGFTADVNTGTGVTTYSGWSPVAQTVLIKYWLYERE